MDHVVLVLNCLILACSNCISAGFTVLTQESPVVVAVGDVAVITCRTSVIRELVEVRWFRSYAGHRYVISVFHDGGDQQRCDVPEYFGRTELVKEGLARGSATLKLFNVSVADEGAYHCFLETADYFDIGDLELRVAALGSHPRIDIGGFQDGGLKVVCRSAGWYPEPTLVNKDDAGEMKIQQEVNGLYSIEYSRIITENSNRTFSCLIQTQFPHQEWESSLYVTDGFFRKSTDVFTILFVVALVLLFATMAILCVSWACRTDKQGSSKFSLPFCTRWAKSKKCVIRDQPSASHYLTDTSSAANTETVHLNVA